MNTSGVDVGGNVDREDGVAVGIPLCVSAKAVLRVAMAVSILSAWLIVGVDRKLLQDASSAARNKGSMILLRILTFHSPWMFCMDPPGGVSQLINSDVPFLPSAD